MPPGPPPFVLFQLSGGTRSSDGGGESVGCIWVALFADVTSPQSRRAAKGALPPASTANPHIESVQRVAKLHEGPHQSDAPSGTLSFRNKKAWYAQESSAAAWVALFADVASPQSRRAAKVPLRYWTSKFTGHTYAAALSTPRGSVFFSLFSCLPFTPDRPFSCAPAPVTAMPTLLNCLGY